MESLMNELPYVEFPWHKFMTEEDKAALEKESEDIIPINELSLNFEEDKQLIKTWHAFSQQLNEDIPSKSFYLDTMVNESVFARYLEEHLPYSGVDVLAKGLFESTASIYTNDYEEIYGLTLLAYERTDTNDGTVRSVDFDLNSLGDDTNIRKQAIRITINDQLEITEYQEIGDPVVEENTLNGLTEESFFDENPDDVIIGFISHINQQLARVPELEDKDSRANVFVRFIDENKSVNNIELSDITNQSLKTMYTHADGQPKLIITSLSHTDIYAEPLSEYTIDVANKETIKRFTVVINRSNNHIEQILEEEYDETK